MRTIRLNRTQKSQNGLSQNGSFVCHQSCKLHQFIITPTTTVHLTRMDGVVKVCLSPMSCQWHCASELEQVSTKVCPNVASQPARPRVPSSAPESMIMFNKFAESTGGVSDLSHTRPTRVVSPCTLHQVRPNQQPAHWLSLTHLFQMSTFATTTATLVTMRAIRSPIARLSTTIALVGVATVLAAFTATIAIAARGT